MASAPGRPPSKQLGIDKEAAHLGERLLSPLKAPIRGPVQDPISPGQQHPARSALRPVASAPALAAGHVDLPAASSGSRCSAASSSSSGGERLRHGTGRFLAEELRCFRRLPTPSGLGARHAELVWAASCSATSSPRTNSRSGSKGHSPKVVAGSIAGAGAQLPASLLSLGQQLQHPYYRSGPDRPKGLDAPMAPAHSLGSSYDSGQEPLPLEDWTAKILERIYPRSALGQESASPAWPAKRPCGSRRTPTGAGARGATIAASLAAAGGLSEAPSRLSEKQEPRPGAQAKLLKLRQRALERFPSMRAAFAEFGGVRGLHREFTRQEFSRFLAKHFEPMSREDVSAIFDFVAEDKHAAVNLAQLHTCMELCVPIASVEDLRRRLVALGHPSMRHALAEMQDGPWGPARRLTLPQFGAALDAVGITDEEEQRCVFQAVCDPSASGHAPATVSLDELSCALSAVSPHLLLEDVRDRLLKRHGQLAAAWAALGPGTQASLSCSEFVARATEAWKLTAAEAEKVFRLVDLGRRGCVARSDVLRALALSEPGLFLEDARRRVRQRFLSIHAALFRDDETASEGPRTARGALSEQAAGPRPASGRRCVGHHAAAKSGPCQGPCSTGEPATARKRTLAEFCASLDDVQLPDCDTQAIFELLDIDEEGRLSTQEFDWGVRLFAPACFLEDLRLRCLRGHGRVAEVFAGLPEEDLQESLNAEELAHVLQQLELHSGVCVAKLMDLLEPHPEGGLSIRELVAAMRSVAPGIQAPLLPEQRVAQVAQQVHTEMARFMRSIRELKADVRQRPRRDRPMLWAEASPRLEPQHHARPRFKEELPGRSGTAGLVRGRVGKEGGSPTAAGSGSRETLTLTHPPVKQSFVKVCELVSTACAPGLRPPTDARPILERLQGYYSMAGRAVASDASLLGGPQSRLEMFRTASGHRRVLERPVL